VWAQELWSEQLMLLSFSIGGSVMVSVRIEEIDVANIKITLVQDSSANIFNDPF